MIALLITFALLSLFLGGLFFITQLKVTSYKAQTEALRENLLTLESRLAQALSERDIQAQRATEASAKEMVAQERANRQKEEMEQTRRELGNEFRLLANTILEEKTERFTQLNRDNIASILTPLNERISEFKTKVEEVYDKEARERFALNDRIKELVSLNQRISEEANNLTRALKGDSKMQGDWGEMILESILEKSGLEEGREYFTQETLSDLSGKPIVTEEGKRMRPDVIVKYPGEKYMVIDAKVSLTAYARYINSNTETERTEAATDHNKSIKAHIDELSKKNYQDYLKEKNDFVMMFVPNEAAYLVAMQHDHALWQYAYDKRVLLLSPTNLIAALKLVSDLWTRDKQGRNAIKIAEESGKLYDKFVGFVADMEKIGKNIDNTQRNYSDAMNKLQTGNGNLIGRVEALRELGVKAKKQLPNATE